MGSSLRSGKLPHGLATFWRPSSPRCCMDLSWSCMTCLKDVSICCLPHTRAALMRLWTQQGFLRGDYYRLYAGAPIAQVD